MENKFWLTLKKGQNTPELTDFENVVQKCKGLKISFVRLILKCQKFHIYDARLSRLESVINLESAQSLI